MRIQFRRRFVVGKPVSLLNAPGMSEPAAGVPEETVLWRANPSLLTTVGPFLWGALIAAAATVASLFLIPALGPLLVPVIAGIWIVCLLPWLWKVVVTKNILYVLTAERFKLRRGVFNRSTEVLELYRVKDMTLDQPFILRLFGLSNIHLTTSDRTTPMVDIRAVRSGEDVLRRFRDRVEHQRDRKRVREVDFDDGDSDGEFLG